MSNANNGGAAFPLANSHHEFKGTNWEEANGMTMRDYFAAKAMAALLSDSELTGSPAEFAQRSYAMADAMLEARK